MHTVENLTDLVEGAEARVMEDAYRALGAYSPEFGAAVTTIDDSVCCVLKSIPSPFFNRVVGLGVANPATEETVEDIVHVFEEDQLPVAVQLSPLARPSTIPAWLEERGFQLSSGWAKFYRDVSAPPQVSTKLRIESIGDSERHDYGRTMAEGFGAGEGLRPWFEAQVGRTGWHHYLAFDGDTPVAGAALFVSYGVGELFGAATIPTHRSQGAQGALLARRIADAASEGCEWIVSETADDTPESPNPSYHNLIRAGFRLAYLRPNYVRNPTAR